MALLGIDIGTSATKGLALSADGRQLAATRAAYAIAHPRPGWAELDTSLVRTALMTVIHNLGAAAAAQGDPVTALAMSVSGDEATPVDRHLNALYPCMMSMDTRSAETARAAEDKLGGDYFYRITGLPPAPNFPVIRMLWLREHEPDVFARTHKLLCWGELAQTWLGAPPIIDHSNASRTLAFDLTTLGWSAEILEALGLAPSLMPECQPSGTNIGNVSERVLAELDLDGPIAVVTGGMDQAMAALGTGATDRGQAVLGLGTWEALTIVVPRPLVTPALRQAGIAFGCHVVPDAFTAMATNPNGGAVTRWVGETLSADSAPVPAYDVEAALSSQPKGPSSITALPHLNGAYAPWMEPQATGVLFGIRPTTTRADLLQALLEANSYELRASTELLADAGVDISQIIVAGGGAKSDRLIQMKANILDREIVQVSTSEAGTLAAACTAGAGAGIWPDAASAARALTTQVNTFLPDAALRGPFQAGYHNYLALHELAKNYRDRKATDQM
jgi:xylulokinase